MAQLQHNMWVTNARCALLSIVTGGGKWIEMTIPADALYQHFLVTAERKFWRCVQTGETPRPYELDADGAAALRERMLADIGALASEDEAADWDHKNLSAKNAFGDDDAKLVEARFREKLAMGASTSEANNGLAVPVTDTPASHVPQMGLPNEDSAVATASSQAQLARPVTTKPIRLRDKEHCRFVATHPCIICGRGPSETHHIRYAQPPAMSRKGNRVQSAER
jgi:hypothetical protein